MSGNSPEWLKKDHYILFKGKPAVVENYFFVSAGGHNNDELLVKIKGMKNAVDMADIEPMSADGKHLPPHIYRGAVVFVEDSRLEFVRRIWLDKDDKGGKETLMVQYGDYSFQADKADKVKPVPDYLQKKALDMVEETIAAENKKAEERKKWETIVRQLNKTRKKGFGI